MYPKLNKKMGLIGAICLTVWGLFILGMQLYVFGYYSQVYGEGTDSTSWSNAYTGMALANSAASLFFGIFYIVAFTEETTTKMLLWGMILAVVGAGAAAASTVLTALEADWLNTPVNTDSQHPCSASSDSQTNTSVPTPLICTNWLALEVTVSVLSGLAFGEYIFIGCVIFMGLSGGKHADKHEHHVTPYHSPAMEPQQPIVRINNNNKPQVKGEDGPYSAYNNNLPSKPRSPEPSRHSYQDLNPQYSYHLQQLSLQQQMAQQAAVKPSPKTSPTLQYRPPQRVAPEVPLHSQTNRGRLQVLHNQRQRAPAPPVPSKPSTNNSSLYRY
ncbi:uncharacterized protein LOC130685953 [Daphnia carinata]|uniref:uncharacterized protein LOC130685953 n=1 Tax=Daphnia carinata TaxID=120202 RepID=UPI00257D5064|nr:uncharacterized protein LOC130685953 [Daphnia carinata]